MPWNYNPEVMQPLCTIADLESLVSVGDEEIRDCIENERHCHLVVVATSPDKEFSAGSETSCHPWKGGDKLIYGAMKHFYVSRASDIPPNHRIVVRGENLYNKILANYDKHETYELSVSGHFPQEIKQDLRGHGFTYWYREQIIHTFLKKGMDEEVTDGIIEFYCTHSNALSLFKFKLAIPWIRRTPSDDDTSGYSHDVGIGSWSDKGYY